MSNDMSIDARRKMAIILRCLAESDKTLGSRKIAREVAARGIDLKERMIRYYLDEMDRLGFTENLGRRGRRITDVGRDELRSAVAVDRVGFVSARVDELAYKLTFDLAQRKGTVVVNISTIPASSFAKAKMALVRAVNAGLGMGTYVAVARGGKTIAGFPVPKGRIALGTVCSVTVNGVLYAHGIPVVSRFGGLLEMKDGEPRRFTHIINYDGTTVDPIEIFIKGKMTGVNSVARTGTGTIGASFREVPAAALSEVEDVIAKLDDVGLGGVLMIGEPGKSLLDIPVSQERVGLILSPGLNPIAALEETGVATENAAMAALCEFDTLVPITDI